MPIYTRTGDTGITSLYGDVWVEKDDPTVDVCGNIDELSASLGVVRAEGLPPQYEAILFRIQQELILFCTEIVFGMERIMPEHIQQMESEIDHFESELPPFTQFVIAGDNRCSALLHLSRTICRRAERSLATFSRTNKKSSSLSGYLNRLSDLLFMMARKIALESVPKLSPPYFLAY
jgi:cob(I)alamin adenosyltransferase